MNADRINEHYFGDPLHPTTQRCRQRIHWICRQVEGRRILDVGCSQGIVCLLLAREGFDCTGIDIELAAINNARAALEKEENGVRQRVRFEEADAANLPFDENTFDTVVLCEILEHVTHPERILKEVQRVLKDSGRVLITVPYGLLAHPDHKRTFYPLSLLHLLRPFFRATLLDALQPNQLVYCGTRDRAYVCPEPSVDPIFTEYLAWTKSLQDRCLGFESSLLETTARLNEQIKSLTGKIQSQQDALSEKETQLQRSLCTAEAMQVNLRSELAGSQAERLTAEQLAHALRVEVMEARTESARARTEVESLKATLACSEKERATLQKELQTGRRLLERSRTDLARLQKEAAVKQTVLEHVRSDLAGAKASLTSFETQISKLRRDSEAQEALLTTARTDCCSLQRQLVTRDREAQRMESELHAVRAALTNSEQQRAAQQEGLTVHAALLKKANEDLSGVEQRLTVAEEKSSRLLEQVSELRAKVGDGTASLERLTTELDSARQLLAGSDTRRAELEVELHRLGEEVKQKQADGEKRLAYVESLQATRLRDQEKRLLDVLAQREAEWKRTGVNQRIRDLVRSVLPSGARVLVISKGDDDLIRLDGRTGMHFPQTTNGVYAGYHPADSAEAIEHLERLKTAGAEYLLIPVSSYWWLDCYTEFRQHLESKYQLLASDCKGCVIFRLAPEVEESGFPLELAIRTAPRVANPEASSSSQSAPTAKSNGVVAPSAVPNTLPNSNGAPTPPVAQRALTSMEVHTVASVSNFSASTASSKVSVAGIFDEFTSACFRPDCNLITFRPDNWKTVLDRHPIDLLFVESAWQANGGSWQYKLASFKKPMGEEIVEVVNYCRDRKIPTVFWNKEDPPHFDRFIHRAPLFDVIFTSDADMVPKYREVVKHDRVFPLPFAAQPRIHHPILETSREHGVCFAGAYYAADHDERRRDMDHLLGPALEFGLHIYDRQHGVVGANARLYQYPDIYQAAIKGRLEYDDMVKAYKWYKVFLNVNSVKTSPTMFSRRVFELLASGTPVISAPAKALPLVLGSGVVLIANSGAQTKAHLEKLLRNEDYWSCMSVQGVRSVLSSHTYTQRLTEVCQRVGVRLPANSLPMVTAVARVETAQEMEKVAANLGRQTYRNFSLTLVPGKALAKDRIHSLLRMHSKKTINGDTDTVMSINLIPAGSNLVQALTETRSGAYVWVINPEDYYGAEFLHDAMLATLYSDADVIAKSTHFEWEEGAGALRVNLPGREYRLHSDVSPGSIVARGDRLEAKHWESILANGPLTLPNLRVLSIDRFNYIRRGQAAPVRKGNGAIQRFARALA